MDHGLLDALREIRRQMEEINAKLDGALDDRKKKNEVAHAR